jgi:hypothetical protein
MWFAKWFGGRNDSDESADYEPADASAPSTTHRVRHSPAKKPGERRTSTKNAGFDPYNSGAFERRAWERIDRR